MIADILDALREGELSLEQAREDIQNRLSSDGEAGKASELHEQLDHALQQGLPSDQGEAIRELLGPPPSGADDDDMVELSLGPEEAPRPVSGHDITDGPPATEDEPEPQDAPSSPESETQADTADAPWETETEEDNAPHHQVVMSTRSDLPYHEEDTGESRSTTTTMIGALLGSRFELLTRLSQDPYGTVYRTRDHERDAANPQAQLCYVRVFPSRLARQEAVVKRVNAVVKRVRRLRHPGILTPDELFRDGEQAWVVSKLPPGQTLARFIRRECLKGLPVDRTLKIVRRIGDALASAHAEGIAHGDLKPSSIFITEDDEILISDFGMRVALFGNSVPSGQAGSTELEQMDPIEAYLSLEIMEGQPPEPSDDIYALACITASLLLGGHPFNGQSGRRRLERKLPAPRIRRLTRNQNRALKQGLEPRREERPPSMEAFLTNLETRRRKLSRLPAAIALVAAVAIAGAWVPVQNWLELRSQQAMIAELEEQGWPGIRGSLRLLDEEDKAVVLPALEERLVDEYARQVRNQLEADDPLEAELILREGLDLYPSAPSLLALEEDVQSARQALTEDIADRLREKLSERDLILHDEERDVPGLYAELKRLAPDHELTGTDTLREHYRQAAESSAEAADPAHVEALAQASQRLFPDQDPIHERMEQLLAAAETLRSNRVAGTIAPVLEQALPPAGLEQVRELRSDWMELLRTTGGHPLLSEHGPAVTEIIGEAVDQAMEEDDWARANALLREFAPMMESASLSALRQQLTRRQLDAGYRPPSLRQERAGLNEAREEVEALLESPRMTPLWSGELILAWREMMAWMRPGQTWLSDLRDRAEAAYLESVEALRDEGAEEDARRMADQGLEIAANSERLRQEAGDASD